MSTQPDQPQKGQLAPRGTSRSPVSSLHSHQRSEHAEHDQDAQSHTSHQAESNFSPPPEEKKQPKRGFWTLISDWFVWEILGVACSAGTLVAIIAILAHFDQQPQPSWQRVSLNSVISWLSTISKGCILLAISECIGQLKWVWFGTTQRPMMNLRSFDSASRGVYGSGELIWVLKAKHFAVWGSLAVILALAFDPFVQNLIHYFPNMVVEPSQRALMANTTVYDGTGLLIGQGISQVDPVLKANVYSSIFNTDQNKPWSIPQYLCSSSNCTWDPVASLEARAYCTNITEHLQPSFNKTDGMSSPNCSLTLANSSTSVWFVPGTSTHQTLAMSSTAPSSALVYKNATFSALQFIAPRGNSLSKAELDTKWGALECSIEPIVRSFRPKVQNNVYTDETLGIWTKSDLILTESMHGRSFQPPWSPEMGISPNTNFTVTGEAIFALQNFLASLFTGAYMEDTFRPTVTAPDESGVLYATRDTIQALVNGNMTGCTNEFPEKFTCTMHNVAAAITKSFRDAAYIGANSSPENAQMAAGRGLASKTYVDVHWQWIVLPALVWLLGAATLVGAMWKTRTAGVPKWKNDLLPLLFLYRDEGKDGIAEWETDQRVDRLGVKLYKSEDRVLLG